MVCGGARADDRATADNNIVLILMVETLQARKNAWRERKVPGVARGVRRQRGDLGNFTGWAQGFRPIR